MTIHHFQPTSYHNTLGPHEPVLHIADGDTVITTTIDAHGADQHGNLVGAAAQSADRPVLHRGRRAGRHAGRALRSSGAEP